jgi:hypothetical protein
MQALDQESNVNSVTHRDDLATTPLFIQGQNQSAEIEIEEDEVEPMAIENPGLRKVKLWRALCSRIQGTGDLVQQLGTTEQDQQLGSSEKDRQLIVKESTLNPQIMKDEGSSGLASLLQQIFSSAQIRIHSTVGPDGSTSFTHLGVGLPGMKEVVFQIPQLEIDMS